MSQNKTGRYFKYALGEIILVVIGILIAIQINTLYSAHAKKTENKLIVNRMLKEVENNISRFHYLDTSSQKFSRAYNLPSYKGCEKGLDSCYKIVLNGVERSNLDYLVENSVYNFSALSTFSSVYEEMLNTGKIYTLKSDSLTTMIDNYYRLMDRQSSYVNMQMQEVQRSYENCKHGWMHFKQAYKTNKEEALQNNQWLFDNNSMEYKNLSNFIFNAKTITIRTRDRIHRCIQESETLSKALKAYLND